MWRVLLETVLATGIFFGLYGAADAVRFACIRVVFSFVRSFFSSRTQQKLCAFMFGILLKHFRRLDTLALSLFMLTLSLSLSLNDAPLNSS